MFLFSSDFDSTGPTTRPHTDHIIPSSRLPLVLLATTFFDRDCKNVNLAKNFICSEMW